MSAQSVGALSGQLSLYGPGADIGGILTTLIVPPLVMGALMCTGMVQDV